VQYSVGAKARPACRAVILVNLCGSFLLVTLPHQCIYCSRTIWPWQKMGYRIGRKHTVYWHGKCRRREVPQ
jgi:hypothetical protein